jgi:outer membrane protein OmpA-like peptidoglycan-associated protein
MKRRVMLLASAVTLAGCANMSDTQRTTATGAGIGAATGAIIGAIAGGSRGAAIGAGIGTAVGAGGGYVWSQRMQQQKQAMEQAAQGTGVAVTQTPDNQLKLQIPSDVSFDTGSATIRPEMRPVLERFASSLNANPSATVRIIGHTDSTGSDAVNQPLSIQRAAAVRDYLVARGVAPQRIVIDGRAAREPIADNANAAGRAQNRRVEVFIAELAQQAAR